MMIKRLSYKLLPIYILSFLFAGIAVLLLPQTSLATSATNFQAGDIISDFVFTNSQSMSVTDIQNFLNSKVPSCDTQGAGSYTFGGVTKTGAQWAQYWFGPGSKNPNPSWASPPFTCLKDYSENNLSSAQIIYNAAQTYSINPQVLIVLLQKEQGLVTDTWPTGNEYQSATGYACPDTAPCSTQYYGLTNQIDNAAYMYHAIMTQNPNWYSPYIVGTNYIQWNPNTSCGGSNVNIQDWSTAALYDYTPYQPNAASLAAGYGTGDSCSSYGNRNFYLYFSDWFGNPLGPDYQATFYKQSDYISSPAGTKKTVYFMFQNTGRLPWGDDVSAAGYNPVHLATDNPINRTSAFADSSWLSPNRPVGQFSAVYKSDGVTLAPDQHVVQTGEIAKLSFTANIGSGLIPGDYDEYFALIREGANDWSISGGSAWTRITVQPTYTVSFYSQSNYPTMSANEQSVASISYQNNGNVPWYDDTSVPAGSYPVHLATTNQMNRTSIFGQSWSIQNRPATTFSAVYQSDGTTLASNQHVVQPGQIGTFTFNLTAPIYLSSGTYQEYFQPILEGAANWNLGANAFLNITVNQTARTASYFSQSNYPTIARGSTGTVYFLFKNTGQANWYDDTSAKTGVYPLHLATSMPVNRASSFMSSGWISSSRPTGQLSAVYASDGTTLTADQHTVQPGQIGKFMFNLTAPSSITPGYYQEYFQPIFEGGPGNTWNIGGQVWIGVTVT